MSKKTSYMHPEDVPVPNTMRDMYPGDAFFGDPKADELRRSQRKDEGGYETTPDKSGPGWEKPEGAEEAPARERYELDKEPKRARNYAALLNPKLAADPETPADEKVEPVATPSAPAKTTRPLPEALMEWKQMSSEIEGLKLALKKLDEKQKGIFDEVGPQMNALAEKTAIIDNLVFKYTEYTSTSVSYSNLWEAALKKVNAATAKVLKELQTELTKPTAPTRKMKVTETTPPKTSRLVFAGIVDTIKGWFGKLLGTLDTAIGELSAVGEDIEQGATTAKKQASRRPMDTLGDDPEWLDDLLPEHLQKRADMMPSGATSPAAPAGPSSSTVGGDTGGGFKPGDNVMDPAGRAGTIKDLTQDGKLNVEFRDATAGPASAVYDPTSPAIKRAATPPQWVRQVLVEYLDLNEDIDMRDMEYFPDPQHPNVWAAKAKIYGGDEVPPEDTLGFLITGKNPDTDVEEVEFKTWPPQSGGFGGSTNMSLGKRAATLGPSGREMDPAARPLARAPAGMATNQETGSLEMGEPTVGLPDVKGLGKLSIIFPNLEMKRYSNRPYFIHNWHNDLKLAAKRAGVSLEGDDVAEYLTANLSSRVAAREFIQKLVKQFNIRPEQIRLAVKAKTAAAKTAKNYRQASDAEEVWLEKFAEGTADESDLPAPENEEMPEDLMDGEEADLAPGDMVEVQSEDGETFTGTVTTKVEEGYLIEKDGEPGSEVEAPAEQVTAIRRLTGIPLSGVLDEVPSGTGVWDKTGNLVGRLRRKTGGPAGHVLVHPIGETLSPRWIATAELSTCGKHRPVAASDDDWLDERSLRTESHDPGLGMKY